MAITRRNTELSMQLRLRDTPKKSLVYNYGTGLTTGCPERLLLPALKFICLQQTSCSQYK